VSRGRALRPEMDTLFARVVVLESSLVLLFGVGMLWRRGVPAHISAFMWQSLVLAGVAATVAHFTGERELYWVAGLLVLVKAVAIPAMLTRMERRFRPERELTPYVNTATSLLMAGLLVLFAYAIMRPVVAASQLPTRSGLPLAMGLVLVSLFVVTSRKKALTQVVGFLMLENGIALLAVLGTYGIPLIVELGVFLDALMGFLVMQIVVHRIYETFDTIDVDRLDRLRH
jgi:hydrogenase-4 component E